MPGNVSEQERLVLTIDEAAARLGLHRQSVRSAIDRGELHAVRIGRKWLVPTSALTALLHGHVPHQHDDGPELSLRAASESVTTTSTPVATVAASASQPERGGGARA